MDTSLGRALTKLPAGAMLCIRDGRGKGLAVFHGHAWITQQDDPRDVVLGAGETFALDRPGLAIVLALEDSSALVFEANPGDGLTPRAPGFVEAAGAPGGLRDTEVPASGPPTSYELHRLARQMRNDAIAGAAHRIADACRLLWTRLFDRAARPVG